MSKSQAYYSPIQIARLALTYLGANPIQSFEDNTPEAITCRDVWPLARDAALQEYPWTFATKTVPLTPEPEDPENPTPYGFRKFRLPGDFLRLLKVTDGKDYDPLAWWKVENRYLIVDTDETIYIEYIYTTDDISLWSPMFCQAVAAKMAMMIAGGMNIDQVNAMSTLYGMAIQNAIARDQDQVPEKDDCLLNPLELARLRA